MARLQQKTQAAVTTGTPKHPAFPAQRFDGLSRALPGVPGLIASIARAFVAPGLDLSVGRPGPHDFAVRTGRARLAPTRPSHPAPNVRDDREPPLLEGAGRARTYS